MGPLRNFKQNKASWDYGTFTSSEMSSITGIPQALQRAWRSRGLLTAGLGRGATYSSRELAETMVRYQLSLNGLPPSESSEIGRDAASSLLLSALFNSAGACEVKGGEEAVNGFLERFRENEELARELAGSPDYNNFVWRGEGGRPTLLTDVSALIGEKGYMSHFFLDLDVAAELLADRAKRPLYHVELPVMPGEARIRRLTGVKQ